MLGQQVGERSSQPDGVPKYGKDGVTSLDLSQQPPFFSQISQR